jgi:hypothetical protein
MGAKIANEIDIEEEKKGKKKLIPISVFMLFSSQYFLQIQLSAR